MKIGAMMIIETIHQKNQKLAFRLKFAVIASGILLALSACSDKETPGGVEPEKSQVTVDANSSELIMIAADQYVSVETIAKLKGEALEAANACNDGFVTACGILGEQFFDGRGVKKNSKEGVRLLNIACEAGDIDGGCGNLGVAYAVGKGVTQDYKKAATLFSKACDAGSKIACDNLKKIKPQYRNIREEFAKKAAEPKENKLYCEVVKVGASCMYLGILYENGETVEQSDIEAAKYFKLACDTNYAAGCYKLGFKYYTGEGVEKNPSQAVQLWQKACKAGHKGSCEVMDKIYASTKRD